MPVFLEKAACYIFEIPKHEMNGLIVEFINAASDVSQESYRHVYNPQEGDKSINDMIDDMCDILGVSDNNTIAIFSDVKCITDITDMFPAMIKTASSQPVLIPALFPAHQASTVQVFVKVCTLEPQQTAHETVCCISPSSDAGEVQQASHECAAAHAATPDVQHPTPAAIPSFASCHTSVHVTTPATTGSMMGMPSSSTGVRFVATTGAAHHTVQQCKLNAPDIGSEGDGLQPAPKRRLEQPPSFYVDMRKYMSEFCAQHPDGTYVMLSEREAFWNQGFEHCIAELQIKYNLNYEAVRGYIVR